MSGWNPGDTAATIIGGLGLVGGVVGFVRSHFASRRADAASVEAATARREAADALRQSADAATESAAALKRSAAADELANELRAELLKPAPEPWLFEHAQGNEWALVNNTGHVLGWTAYYSPDGAFEERDEFINGPIGTGHRIMIRAVRPFEDATIRVVWGDPETLQQRERAITVRNPWR